MNHKIDGHIYTTDKYDIFVQSKENRPYDERHMLDILESIKETGQWTPIEVEEMNGKYRILKGQHRFEACKRLGIAVRFVFSKNTGIAAMVLDHMLPKKWKTEDAIRSFAFKSHHYKLLENAIKESGLGVGSFFVLFLGNTSRTYVEAICNGSYKFDRSFLPDYERRHKVVMRLATCADGVYKDTILSVKFLAVLVALIDDKNFSFQHLKKRLEAQKEVHGTQKVISTNNDLFLNAQHLENLYNQYMHGLPMVTISHLFNPRLKAASRAKRPESAQI
jgi:hypothetical protein